MKHFQTFTTTIQSQTLNIQTIESVPQTGTGQCVHTGLTDLCTNAKGIVGSTSFTSEK
ncbi:hypothetical protein DPMN_140168 [Dreissena polymorpha]|uniref:Uncharacterized protein n=1 Tax=Dreissena polymorpha TaxID=45954 RepID=A0A9D4GAH8_DREPO|nr:hypothetical protein DPMN_140168 [Dreissena polymorpha]